MKKRVVLLSIMTGVLLLGGCGESVVRDSEEITQQPHEKTNRTYKDWTWNVGAEVILSDKGFKSVATYYSGMPESTKHTQFFIDTTPGKGFNGSNGWEIEGADYLIEDDKLYKSLSDTEWKWQQIGSASTKTVGTGNDKRTTFTAGSVVAKAINSKKVNIFLETYDKDWNGVYLTVVMKDTKVSGAIVVEKTLKELVEDILWSEAGTVLTQFVPRADKKGAIGVALSGASQYLRYFDSKGDGYTIKRYFHPDEIKDITIINDTIVSYKLREESDYHNVYLVKYDFIAKKELSRENIYSWAGGGIRSTLKETTARDRNGESKSKSTTDYIYQDGKIIKMLVSTDGGKKIEKEAASDFKIRKAYEDPSVGINGEKLENPKYTRNDKNQITKVEYGDGMSITVTYDDKGQVIKKSRRGYGRLWREFSYNNEAKIVKEVYHWAMYSNLTHKTYTYTY